MAKRGSDAEGRIFFDELVSLTASRLRAAGAIRLEDRQAVIPFGEHIIGVAHTVFRNGGSWSYFVCPKRRRRAKKLWLVDDAWLREVLLVLRSALPLRATAPGAPSA
jgi:hypothetical protein